MDNKLTIEGLFTSPEVTAGVADMFNRYYKPRCDYSDTPYYNQSIVWMVATNAGTKKDEVKFRYTIIEDCLCVFKLYKKRNVSHLWLAFPPLHEQGDAKVEREVIDKLRNIGATINIFKADAVTRYGYKQKDLVTTRSYNSYEVVYDTVSQRGMEGGKFKPQRKERSKLDELVKEGKYEVLIFNENNPLTEHVSFEIDSLIKRWVAGKGKINIVKDYVMAFPRVTQEVCADKPCMILALRDKEAGRVVGYCTQELVGDTQVIGCSMVNDKDTPFNECPSMMTTLCADYWYKHLGFDCMINVSGSRTPQGHETKRRRNPKYVVETTTIKSTIPYKETKQHLMDIQDNKDVDTYGVPYEECTLDINLLRTDPFNTRLHNEKNVSAIMESLRRFGQYRRLVVQKDTHIVLAGNGTLEAMKMLGFKEAKCYVVDVSEQQAKALSIADNRSSELAEWDVDKLFTSLRDLSATDLFEATGFDYGDLVELSSYELGDIEVESSGEQEGVVGEFIPEFESITENPTVSDMEKIVYSNGLTADKSMSMFGLQTIKDEAMRQYREGGFPYVTMKKTTMMMEMNKLASTPMDKLQTTLLANGVANSYHPEMMEVTTEDKGLLSPVSFFENDKQMERLIERLIMSGIDPVGFSSTHFYIGGVHGAANFRPGYVVYILRKYLPFINDCDAVYLDTCAGWGGRLIGAMCSHKIGRYIGIDPHTRAIENNQLMADELGFTNKVDLVNMCAEDVPVDKYKDKVDICFTSPPYFNKEHYSQEDTQSYKKHGKSVEDWTFNFLWKMIELQYHSLKPGRYSIININDIVLRNGNKTEVVPLVEPTILGAKQCGFEFVGYEETYKLGPSMNPLGSQVKKKWGQGEPTLIFKKPEGK